MRNPEKVFIKSPEEIEPEKQNSKQADRLLAMEILSDLSAFPEEDRQFMEENAAKPTNSPDIARYHRLVSAWWNEKYGSNINVIANRNEILFRKYMPLKLEEIHGLQADFFKAVKLGDEERIAELKKEYLDTYPDTLESVEVLFGIRDFLLKQKAMNEEKERIKRTGERFHQESHEQVMKKFRDLTEYQFLFTHFLLAKGGDREFLEAFWDAAEQIAKRLDMSRDLNMLRRGQISQVATYKIIEQISHKPVLSHPDEDAFSAVDLWSDEGTAIQIKGANQEQPALLSVDEIYFPAIAANSAAGTNMFNSIQMQEMQKKNMIFNAKIRKLGELQHRQINGFMMVIPYSKVDFVTGEPSQELVDFFKERLDSLQPAAAKE
ncbi:MAG: hypothetical protein WCT26_01400 [Candidatus Buchananbacteria bacterium]